ILRVGSDWSLILRTWSSDNVRTPLDLNSTRISSEESLSFAPVVVLTCAPLSISIPYQFPGWNPYRGHLRLCYPAHPSFSNPISTLHRFSGESHQQRLSKSVKAKLKGGKVAAVKVLSAESRQGVREFFSEINVIADIEHENLVKLHGCCVEENHRILVYGYLENSSLAQTLLDRVHNNINFDWKTRSKICIGVARGLAFLHEEVEPHIIHRDIKASNILLDKDLTPKISDFGLAKLLPPNMTHVSTRVAGTIGYLAPEYAIRGQLTRKADIYSFGVLLLEIVCGRCNTDPLLPVEEQDLLNMNPRQATEFDMMPGVLLLQTWELFERRELVMLVDPSLNGDYDVEEACRILKIGLLCTQDSPKLRPSMSSVVKMLTGEKSINDDKITKPGLISDFMDLKVRVPKTQTNTRNTFASGTPSQVEDTPMSSGNVTNTTFTTMTGISDRSS
ncbi:cold-responsive protein kinase 1-like, partial [Magnolia sinica]|uniref:cold-responsive protein kinase 1-like n=1 Tax=Magnolia sinica TaxID=86752 RepID=UPI002659031C